jgi:hypothetical protein
MCMETKLAYNQRTTVLRVSQNKLTVTKTSFYNYTIVFDTELRSKACTWRHIIKCNILLPYKVFLSCESAKLKFYHFCRLQCDK